MNTPADLPFAHRPESCSVVSGSVAPHEVRFLVIDDHPLVAFALIHLLDGQPGWSVAMHASSPRAALDAVREGRFDIAMIDLLFPDDSGMDFIRWLQQESPRTRPIVYSIHRADIYARRCIQCGAAGYAGKDAPIGVLLSTIRRVLDGQTVINGVPLTDAESRVLKERSRAGLDTLSRRELEVLTLLGQGLSNTRIAQILCRSAKTIESHRYRIAHKLGIENGPPLLHFAVQHRLAAGMPGFTDTPSDTDTLKELSP